MKAAPPRNPLMRRQRATLSSFCNKCRKAIGRGLGQRSVSQKFKHLGYPHAVWCAAQRLSARPAEGGGSSTATTARGPGLPIVRLSTSRPCHGAPQTPEPPPPPH